MLTSKKVNCISSSHDHAGPSILCMQVLWITQKICFKESKRLRIRSQGEKKKKKDKRGKKKKKTRGEKKKKTKEKFLFSKVAHVQQKQGAQFSHSTYKQTHMVMHEKTSQGDFDE